MKLTQRLVHWSARRFDARMERMLASVPGAVDRETLDAQPWHAKVKAAFWMLRASPYAVLVCGLCACRAELWKETA